MEHLWIIRHALSKGNVGQPTSSPETTTLESIEGRAQAKQLANALMREFQGVGHYPGYFGATTYFRTQQTLFPILDMLGRNSYEVLGDFREITYLSPGKYNGTTQDNRKAIAQKYWETNDPDYIDGEGADSFNQVASNLRHGLDQLRYYPQQFGLLASHGLVMSLIDVMDREPALNGSDLMAAFRRTRESQSVPNCALLKLHATKDGWAIRRDYSSPFINLIGN